jgi:hypothetical protein
LSRGVPSSTQNWGDDFLGITLQPFSFELAIAIFMRTSRSEVLMKIAGVIQARIAVRDVTLRRMESILFSVRTELNMVLTEASELLPKVLA